MSLDPKICQAVKDAVAAAEQPPALARLITAWMEAVASGNEDPHDHASATRHLELLNGQTVVKDGEPEPEAAEEDDE